MLRTQVGMGGYAGRMKACLSNTEFPLSVCVKKTLLNSNTYLNIKCLHKNITKRMDPTMEKKEWHNLRKFNSDF